MVRLGHSGVFLAVMSACLALLLCAGGWVLVRPTPRWPLIAHPFLASDVAPLGLAVALWLSALFAERAGLKRLAYVFGAGSALMAAGRLASLGSDVGARLFYGLLVWSAPMVYRLHQGLLAQPPGCIARSMMVPLVLLAVAASVPLTLYEYRRLISQPWFGTWRAVVEATVVLGGVCSVGLLGTYWLEGWPEARSRHIRVILFGNVVAVVPVLVLSVLPSMWGTPVRVGYSVTWICLLIAPIAYIHALTPTRDRVEATLRQGAAAYLLIVLFATSTLLTMLLLHGMLGLPVDAWPFVSLPLLFVFLMLRPVLWEAALRLTEEIWEGKGARYDVIVGRLAESLSATLRAGALQRSLVHRVSRALHLSWAALFLRLGSGTVALVESHGLVPSMGSGRVFWEDGALAEALRGINRPIPHSGLLGALQGAELSGAERSLLSLPRVALWVPLIAGGELMGVLLVGPKQAGDALAPQDVDILATLARQSAVAMQSARLMEEVEVGREELAKAHREILDAGEQERLRLARDLHDGAVQQLIGISYELAAGRRACDLAIEGDRQAREALCGLLESTRQEVLEVVSQLRALIGELRPAGLEEMGLEAALDGYVARLQRRIGSRPTIDLEMDLGGRVVSHRVALGLFRVAQEGLRNALRHARASHIDVRLATNEDGVELLLVDDGKGFIVPARLTDLALENHFGLVSMSERVAQMGGTLTIHSVPGVGTELRALVPFGEEVSDDGREDSRAAG